MLALVAAMVLAAQTPHPDADRPLQILAGPSFEALLRATGVRCPQSRVRYSTPARLLDVEEAFIARLPPNAARRLNAVSHKLPDGGYPACADRDGASCPAGRTLETLRDGGLLDAFAGAVCARGSASWD